MVKYSVRSLDATFSALGDPTRRAILARLARGEASVTEVAGPFAMSLPAISKHVRVLEHAGLLTRQRAGRIHRLRLVARPLRDAAEWIARYRGFWGSQLDALARHLKTAAHGEAIASTVPTSKRRSPSQRRSRRPATRRRRASEAGDLKER